MITFENTGKVLKLEYPDFKFKTYDIRGRHDLQVGKEYTIKSIPWDADRNVPNNERGTWTRTEFPMVRWGWYQVYLEGISDSVFLHNFKPKQNENKTT